MPDSIWTMDAATTLCHGLAQGSSEALGQHQLCTCPRSLLEVAARGRDKDSGAAPPLLAASTSGHSAEAPPPAVSDTAALCGRSAGLSRCGASPALRSRLKRRGGSAASASAASASAGAACSGSPAGHYPRAASAAMRHGRLCSATAGQAMQVLSRGQATRQDMSTCGKQLLS